MISFENTMYIIQNTLHDLNYSKHSNWIWKKVTPAYYMYYKKGYELDIFTFKLDKYNNLSVSCPLKTKEILYEKTFRETSENKIKTDILPYIIDKYKNYNARL
jgi:hypothetical protein